MVVSNVNASKGSKFMVNGRSMPHPIITNNGKTHRQIWVEDPMAMPRDRSHLFLIANITLGDGRRGMRGCVVRGRSEINRICS